MGHQGGKDGEAPGPAAATSCHFTIPRIRWHSGPRGNQEPKQLPGLGQLNLLHWDPCPLPLPTSLWALGAGQQEAKG